MLTPKVTVAIPTFNRYELLLRAIDSVVRQSFTDFELLIVDNASTDETRNLARASNDARLRYVRNSENLGIIGNWNRSIDLACGEYILIFHDDDLMHPTFLQRSIAALDEHPTVGFCFPLVRRVDLQGSFLNLWCDNYNDSGKISGIRYLEITLEKERCISIAPSMLFRKSVYDTLGFYAQEYGFNTFDLNFFGKAALDYDVYIIDEILFDYTIHPHQMSERHWRTPNSPTGPIGMLIELIGIVSTLTEREYAQDLDNRKFLAERLASINHNLIKHIATEIRDI